MWGEGPDEAKIALVGEAPEPKELRSGRPFHGPAGAVLNVACAAAGLSRGTVYVTNVVKCMWPQFRKPTRREVEHCTSAHLGEELKGRNVVVALGDTALKHFVPDSDNITRVRGFVLEVEE